MDNRERENRETCKHIALEIEEIASGSVYKCPHCGELIVWNNDNYDDERATYHCDNCGSDVDESDLEPYTLYDYFSDCFDIEYRVSGSLEYRSVQVMIACGGPNIYIDTASKNVELYWWSERAFYPLAIDAVEEIDALFEEYFSMR